MSRALAPRECFSASSLNAALFKQPLQPAVQKSNGLPIGEAVSLPAPTCAYFTIGIRRSPPVISFGNPSSSRFSSVGEMSRSDPSVRSR